MKLKLLFLTIEPGDLMWTSHIELHARSRVYPRLADPMLILACPLRHCPVTKRTVENCVQSCLDLLVKMGQGCAFLLGGVLNDLEKAAS